MNLSDLVHRTAGDNKVLKGTANNLNSTTRLLSANTNITTTKNGNTSNNTFQQSIIDPSSASNVFSNFTRPDQPFLFTMQNTDWMNNDMLFNSSIMSGNDALIEPMDTVAAPNTANSFLKQDSTPNSAATNNNLTPSTSNNTQQQQIYQPPSIAPFPSQLQGLDLSNSVRPLLSGNNNNLANAAIASALASAMATKSATASSITIAPTPISITNTPKPNTPITTSTEIMTAVSPSTTTSEQSMIAPSAHTAPTSSTLARIKSRSKVTGENVTASNFEEGYIQFVLSHDPNYIHDGIESLIYAKRKFQSVPKTGDLSYTTWDIYQLVVKLQHQEIKNWSQLVGQLGLADMAGRPQFAQRVKRWMHRYKIDCYFDYLLGNPFQFHGPAGKYSTCLMMGNYKKRRTDNDQKGFDVPISSSVNTNRIESQSDLDDEVNDDADNEHRIPILLAGSRKRMRENSQNSLQIIESARQFVRPNQSESEEEEGSDSELKQSNINGNQTDNDNDQDDNGTIEEQEEEDVEEFADEEDELASSSSSPSSPTRIIIPSPKVSSVVHHSPLISKPTPSSLNSFSKPSPTIAHTPPINKTIQSPTNHKPVSSPIVSTTPTIMKSTPPMSLLSSLPPLLSCSNCSQNETKVTNLEKEALRLKQHIMQLEAQTEKQNAQVKKLLRLRDRTEKWRKQIISDLARGPLITSDNDDVDEDEEEEEEEDDEEDEDEDEEDDSSSG